MYSGFQHGVPPGGIVPGTATGVNPFPNNKPGVNLNSYLNNTPTTTSNFAPPPSFNHQTSATGPYVPHGGSSQQWNAGTAQPNAQSHYGQTGVSGFPANVSPNSGFGAPAGYQQSTSGFNAQGGSGVAPSGFNSGAYGAQPPPPPPPPQQQQPAPHTSSFYPGQNSGGSTFGATYAGSVTGPPYSQPQDPNRPSFGQYHSPPPANTHQPPGAYGQPTAGGIQPTYGQAGYNASGFPPVNQAPAAAQPSYGAASQTFNSGFTAQQQPQQPAQTQHQGWQAGYAPTSNPADPVQSISQQWAQNNQQAQTHNVDQNHNKRYSVASVNEPYHSAYATATPPPPAAPKPERPATSATFFAATAGALKTPAPSALSPSSGHAQPHAADQNVRPKPATSSGFAGGGIGDWEHYGDFEGDDNDTDATSGALRQETAAEVPGDPHPVEMAAGTPPQLQQPFPIAQNQQPAGVQSPPRTQPQGPPMGHANPQPTQFENGQQTAGPWGTDRPQSGGRGHAGLQFQGFGNSSMPPAGQNPLQNPAIQNLQQPLRTSSPSHDSTINNPGYGAGQMQYQQPQQGGPPQTAGSNLYNGGFASPPGGKAHQLNQHLQKQQEEQLRQQQEEQLRQQEEQLRQQQQQQQQQQEEQLRQQQEEQIRLQQEEQIRRLQEEEQIRRLQEEEQIRRLQEEEQMRRLQEEEQMRQHQEQQQQLNSYIQAQIQQQQQRQQQLQQQVYNPQALSPSQQAHPYGQQTQSPPAQAHPIRQPTLGGAYQQFPGQSPPAGLQSVPPQHGRFSSPSAMVADPYGQPPYGDHQRQSSLNAAAQPPTADAYGQSPAQQLHQALFSGGSGPSAPDGVQQSKQYGQPAPGHIQQTSVVSTIVQQSVVTTAEQLPPRTPPVQETEIKVAQKPAQPITEDATKPADGLEAIEIPADLDPYYKDSIKKFVRMIVREASAKSSVESLRIFTDFMEDETYSRGDRYSDASLNDYISDGGKSYSFAGRLRPYTTESPTPYDSSRRTSVHPENVNARDYTFDSIDDSPLTHAIEALRLTGNKGTTSPPVEHRLPFTIDEQHEPVPPLNHQQQQPPAHISPSPAPRGGSAGNIAPPYTAHEKPAEPITHHNTWGGHIEHPAVAELGIQEPVAPIQPLSLKRRSFAVASPQNQNPPYRPPTTSPAPDSAQPTEAHLAQQAALLAKQWIDARDPSNAPNRQSSELDASQPAPLALQHGQPAVVNQLRRQSLAQDHVPYQQSSSHFDPAAQAQRQSPAPTKDPYKQHLTHSASFPTTNHHEPPPRDSTPKRVSRFADAASTPRSEPPKTELPKSEPPRNELPVQINIPQQPELVKQPVNDNIDAPLDTGYVLVSPEPQPAPVDPVVIDLSSPINVTSISRDPLAAQKKPKVDISVLSKILGEKRAGLPDKSKLLLPIREACEKVGKEFLDVDKKRRDFEVEAKEIREMNEAERDRLKSEHDEYTEELYSQQKILYEDLHDIDENFNATQNDLKEKQEKAEFDKFNEEIFTPVYNIIQERIAELKKQHKALLGVIKTASSGREKFEPKVNKPHLQDALMLLVDLHDTLEAHHMKLQEAIADRDKRFKSTVLTPLYASNNYAKLRDAKKHFDEEEKKAVVKGATDAYERAKAVKAVIDESMIPGLDLEFGFFDEVEQCSARIIEGLPEDPAEYSGDKELLHSELSYASTVLEALTQTQLSLFKLYHQVNAAMGLADKAIAVGQAKQKGEKPEAIKKVEDDKDALSQKMDDELKERLEDVNGHFAEAKGKLEPILAKYGPAPAPAS
ncbi:hypothetical protein DRE_04550 [Drechslerella stenobrocha 248]|uniref:Uncharacterized protein n=1 Tax=Drechslerella stenobrocha 248 TaxID=1043628 RepID=W7I0Y5_9PEZI|nr:hypothetical protein DRE_04550 [Drechslerella stenobrocha 248]